MPDYDEKKMCATSSVEEREVCGRRFDSSVAQYDEENIISGIVSLHHDILDDHKIFKLAERFKENGFKELWAERGFYFKISYDKEDFGNIFACFAMELPGEKARIELENSNLHKLIERATQFIIQWEAEHAK